jgi:SAM-dependent methyltransferase
MSENLTLAPSLVEALDELEGREAEGWARSLSARKRAEVELHDEHREVVSCEGGREQYREYANSKYYKTARESRRYIESWLEENARGRLVLDFACGNGIFSFKAARAGAAYVVGIDISGVSVASARRQAENLGIADRVRFVQADCEQTELPSGSFDVALCGGVLHHLDLSYALPELRRLLRPGGRLLAVEPLNINPFFQLYRKVTGHLRTEFEAEHILSLSDIKFIGRFIDVLELRYFHLFSLLAAPFHRTALFGPILGVTEAVDRIVTRIPLARLMCWQLCLSAEKER